MHITANNITFIGDCHAKWQSLRDIFKRHETDLFIQLGDMGLGFPNWAFEPTDKKLVDNKCLFIRGNHDNYKHIQSNHSNSFIDDGKILDWNGVKIMCIGGANSIDKRYRLIGYDYWDDEEVNTEKSIEILNLYDSVRPQIMITHDCPLFLYSELFQYNIIQRTTTSSLLDALYEIHKPKLWLFGHHHKSVAYNKDGTQFRCLNELECLTLKRADWSDSHE